MSERLNDVAEIYRDNAAVMEVVEFIGAVSNRSVCQPKAENAA